jgi:[acyl-carrier-protein] S-malonyltransferase
MALGFIVGGGLNDEPDTGRALHERYPEVRATYEQIGGWTGLSAERLFSEPLPASELRFREGIGALRQAAAAFAVADLLACRGVTPHVVGGLSLGAMVSASLAGAVDRGELFGLLMAARDAPVPPTAEPAQGVAMAFAPDDGQDLAPWAARAGVYQAVELGPVGDGGTRMVMFSGYRAGLDRLAATAPDGVTVRVPEDRPVAFHSPLQRAVADHLRPVLDAMRFRDPSVPLCSCLEPAILTTAAQVRDLFERNSVQGVSVPHVRSQMRRLGVRLGIVLGPSKIDRMARPSFPLLHVECPGDLDEAVAAVYELGVALPEPAAAGGTSQA